MAGAIEYYRFQVTCEPGVTPDAPQVTDITMPVRTIKAIRIRVPPGPSGAMGFALGSTGANIIPIQDGTYLTADDEIFNLPPDDLIDSGSFQVRMYNIGLYEHTIYLDFTAELPDPDNGASSAAGGSLAAIGALSSAAAVTVISDPDATDEVGQ